MSGVVKAVGKAVSGVAKGVSSVVNSVAKTVKKVAPIAAPVLAIAAPGIGTAIGATLGATGTAATVVGGGLLGAAGSAIGGKNPLTGAVLGAGGAYLGGMLSSPASSASSVFGSTAADSAFIAADAAQLAGQGLSQGAIEQTLLSSGVDAFIAADAAQLASQGLGASAIAQSIGQSAVASGKPSLFSNILNTGSQLLGNVPQQLLQAGVPGATGGGGSLLSSLLGAGINYGVDAATVKRLTDLAQKRRGEIQSQFGALAEQAEVPFTPYTVSTGFGTSTFGPDRARTRLSPEYANIRSQALTGATEALGSINPATATQDYFDTLEALSAPTRQREQERLLGTLGNRGLLGFGQNMPTAGGMTRTVNPLMESLLSSQATERLQQSLAAQKYGTTEAANRAALSSSLLGIGTGLDTTAANQLAETATLSQIPYRADVSNRERQLQLERAGLVAGMPYDEAVFNLAAGREQGLGNFYRQGAERLFNEIFR